MAHKHSVYDTDPHFSINPSTRAIKNESATKTILVQYDHNSERFTFEIPRYIDGHDMSVCNAVKIHYRNISANKNDQSVDVYSVDDLQVSPEDDKIVIFSWLISANATKYAGTLNFLIRFTCLNGSVIEYSWNTSMFSGINVADGMDNGEAVIVEYSDVLEAWKEEVLESLKDTGIDGDSTGTIEFTDDDNGNVTVAIDGGGTLTFTDDGNGNVTMKFGEGGGDIVYDTDLYEGDYEITPKTTAQTMETEGKLMADDVTVNEIPYAEVSNTSGGNTVTIGSEV